MNLKKYLTVDISLSSSLQWNEVRLEAAKLVEEGKKIGWIFKTGLFENLPFPLAHEGQFRNLSLGITQFMDTLGKEFASSTTQVILYKGAPFFSRHEFLEKNKIPYSTFIQWLTDRGIEPCAEEKLLLHLFSLDLMVHYLNQLGKGIPEKWGPFLQFDPWPDNLLLEALLTNPERWGNIKILWEGRKNRWELASDTAIYWPSVNTMQPAYFLSLVDSLENKWIPEERLTTSWEGLNNLWVVEEALSSQGKRMVAGFLAAGGDVYSCNSGKKSLKLDLC